MKETNLEKKNSQTSWDSDGLVILSFDWSSIFCMALLYLTMNDIWSKIRDNLWRWLDSYSLIYNTPESQCRDSDLFFSHAQQLALFHGGFPWGFPRWGWIFPTSSCWWDGWLMWTSVRSLLETSDSGPPCRSESSHVTVTKLGIEQRAWARLID